MKKLARILSIIMICCISFLFVGCMGSSPEDNDDDFENGNPSSSMAFDMYGTKVLYRPDEYDYNAGSGGTAEKTNDYYGKYAYYILNALYNTYGIIDDKSVDQYINGLNVESEDYTSVTDADRTYIKFDTEKDYLYDSIRYKTDTVGTVTKTKIVLADGTEGEATAINSQYTIVGANPYNTWKWTFDYDMSNFQSGRYNALLFHEDYIENAYTASDGRRYSKFESLDTFNTSINQLYGNNIYSTIYQTIYLGTAIPTDTTNYSDFVKALEYVVYSYALDLEPKAITVEYNDNVTNTSTSFYTVTVESYSATSTQSSVDVALADIKDLFEDVGSYVGLMQRQITKISNWVKANVIGLGETIYNDNFTTYQNVTEVTTLQEDGSSVISYEFDISTSVTGQLGRNYENAVDNIVDAVCNQVSIGSDGDSDVTIDNRFLASEVKEYAGNSFFITGDENFPAPNVINSPTAIQPLEYQSVQFMLKEEILLTDVWVALKYDAALDGTQVGVYDQSSYLDIIVELNYYNHTQNKLFTLGSQQTRVYDGPYKNVMEENKYGLPDDDHGTIFFSDFDENCKDAGIESVMDSNGNIKVGAFNTEIGNGILKTDASAGNYSLIPVSQNPLLLTGLTDVRKYYSIIEPTDEELGTTGKTYVTGRANEKMYAGNDGCDYIELTYKVLKNKGDRNTNYKFYTGVVAVFDAFTDI